MTVLVKAVLEELSHGSGGAKASNPIEVQFNPTSLGLQITNKTDNGRAKGRQTKQYMGKTSTELTLELVFDTADEGTPEAPRSVREKTAMVERFVLPKAGRTQAPPKLRFRWDKLIIDGLVESVHVDFDLFAANGTPLRAKVKLTLKEQDSKYELVPTSPQKKAPPPRPGGAAPGSDLDKSPDREAAALAGETAAEFAARVGLDPAAWRGLDIDLGASLTFEAGVSVGFRADLDVQLGVGLTAGVAADVRASVESTLGLDGDGRKLASAGGVTAALHAAAETRQREAVAETRAAFAVRARREPTAATERTPLRVTETAARPTTSTSPTPQTPDTRAASFGRGVPLRDRFRPDFAVSGDMSRDPTRPPWETLPPRTPAPTSTPRSNCSCGCRGTCGCKGGR